MLEVGLWQERYREHLELQGFSARTVRTYTDELGPFLDFLAGVGLESLTGLTREHIEGYRLHLFHCRHPHRGHGIALSTQSVRLGAVKAFVRFLARQGYLLIDVAAGVEGPKAPRTLPRTILSEHEMRQLLEAPNLGTSLGVRDRTILEVLYGTAIRNSELCALELSHLDRERQVLLIELGKGGKSRVVPLGEEALSWLEEYLVGARPSLDGQGAQTRLFLSCRGRPLGRDSLNLLVRRLGRQAGLRKNVTPHVLRHSCATHMLRRGAGLRHLQLMLGHASSTTTDRYTRVEVSDLRNVIRRCHPRERRR